MDRSCVMDRPIADTLAGSGLAPHLAPGGQYFAIFADGHNRQLPKITGGPFRYNFYAGELVKKAIKMTSKPLHQAVIAPSMMYLLYQLDGDIPGYPRKQFEDDIVNECEKDIRSCFDAGAAHVVMDFTEGRLAPRNDPRNPWTTRHLNSTIGSSIAFRHRSTRISACMFALGVMSIRSTAPTCPTRNC
jgi:hypothetical protein